MSNRVVKTFIDSGSWTCPANVTSVRVQSIKNQNTFSTFSNYIDPYGNLYTWGENAAGQLGQGDVTVRSTPTLVAGGVVWQKLVTGNPDTGGTSSAAPSVLGLTTTGDIYGWGGNLNGNLGNGDVIPRSTPTLVTGGLKYQNVFMTQFPAVSLATVSSFGLTNGGDLYAWGVNLNGQLGTGDVLPKSVPTLVLGGFKFVTLTTAANASAGPVYNHSVIALDRSGNAYAWGYNNNGELGVGDRVARSSPVAVVGALTFARVYSVSGSSFGLTTAGALYAWGSNARGQLGVGDILARSSPVAVLGGLVFRTLAVSNEGTTNASILALTTDNNLYAWGSNAEGQLGLGDVVARSSPVLVAAGIASVFMSGGRSSSACYAYAITTAGVLYAWGGNLQGQLGVGDVTSRSTPTLVLGSKTWMSLTVPNTATAGGNAECAMGIANDGFLYAWGGNGSGQLGDGTVIPQSSPILIATPTFPNVQPVVDEIEIAVVPGTVYAITVGPGREQSLFGLNVVGRRSPRILKVIYET